MLLAIGTKVRLKNTGDVGVIREVLGDDFFSVYIPEKNIEIPSSDSNLERINTHKTKGQIVKGKQVKPKPEPPSVNTQYKILSKKGILLAFLPKYNQEEVVEAFDLYLINDTSSDAIYSFELRLNKHTLLRRNHKMQSTATDLIGTISYAQLNDKPSITVSCWKVTTQETGSEYRKQFRIKPQQFFAKKTTAPLLNRSVHLYTLFKKLDQAPQESSKKSGENLSSYTRRKAQPTAIPKDSYFYPLNDVEELAYFSGEIDLHIHQLVAYPDALDKKEILRTQLRHFDDFLAKAIRIGAERCFAIHGIGKGKLRDEIAKRLKHHPNIKTFKNEYHHKYGWGATEIVIK
ncbi:MAG: Smr/MutS family protein [Bacteroidota bacterium]